MNSLGNVYTCSVRDIEEMVKVLDLPSKNVFIITRSDKLKPLAKSKNYTYYNGLAPSWDLFRKVKEYKGKNPWNQEAFDYFYRPRFLTEFTNHEKFRHIKYMARKIIESEDILLVCFCDKENMCHRSIVKELIDSYVTIPSNEKNH